MRYFQFRSQLTEASPYLTGDELMKDRKPDRKETFLNFINNPTPFKTKDGTYFQGKISGVSTDGKLLVTHDNGDRKLYEEKTLIFTAFQH